MTSKNVSQSTSQGEPSVAPSHTDVRDKAPVSAPSSKKSPTRHLAAGEKSRKRRLSSSHASQESLKPRSSYSSESSDSESTSSSSASSSDYDIRNGARKRSQSVPWSVLSGASHESEPCVSEKDLSFAADSAFQGLKNQRGKIWQRNRQCRAMPTCGLRRSIVLSKNISNAKACR